MGRVGLETALGELWGGFCFWVAGTTPVVFGFFVWDVWLCGCVERD